jgi:hypothetical protein
VSVRARFSQSANVSPVIDFLCTVDCTHSRIDPVPCAEIGHHTAQDDAKAVDLEREVIGADLAQCLIYCRSERDVARTLDVSERLDPLLRGRTK